MFYMQISISQTQSVPVNLFLNFFVILINMDYNLLLPELIIHIYAYLSYIDLFIPIFISVCTYI